ncbi:MULTISPECIES: poly-gamma-glutamate biosynthesis protein PgsC [Fusobacterium]|uniref:poly-gamma-glutamate biosynthesis protein PgsC n=1 Tax=Fusobacterium TaxID=848 RepID=UPI001F2AABA5|nr:MULTISPECIES: poly-gamma-glutamate biosynthesis protein PgsC [Fusobacterium]MCF2612421.1 poly-gamma-glutamate biosynthesis protein PgsC [Fusobacterium perfoetens]MDY2981700.1 poly-gamma-glutamate biosynthesis protein PgsC [Fusobacterium sp.]
MVNEIIILGIIISIIFYEITEISPGGLIVPAYLAFYMDNPKRVIVTILSGIITYFIVKVISDRTILYGRRKFTVYVLVGFLMREVLKQFNIFLEGYDIFILGGNIIGVIIPAIMARDIERNGMIKSIFSLLMLSTFIKAVVEIVYEVGGLY